MPLVVPAPGQWEVSLGGKYVPMGVAFCAALASIHPLHPPGGGNTEPVPEYLWNWDTQSPKGSESRWYRTIISPGILGLMPTPLILILIFI